MTNPKPAPKPNEWGGVIGLGIAVAVVWGLFFAAMAYANSGPSGSSSSCDLGITVSISAEDKAALCQAQADCDDKWVHTNTILARDEFISNCMMDALAATMDGGS